MLKDLDFIVGPLIPKNFNIISNAPSLSQLIKIAPLSSVPVVLRKNVFQKIQKTNINNTKVKWISNFNNIKKGPLLFIGNEFFDAIPIKMGYQEYFYMRLQ